MVYAVEIFLISVLVPVQIYALYYSVQCLVDGNRNTKYYAVAGFFIFFSTAIFSFYLTYYVRKYYIYSGKKPPYFTNTAILGTIICLIFTLLLYSEDQSRRKKELRADAIQFAVNGVDQGICIYKESDGLPILMNQSMYELVHQIFQKTVMDGEKLWMDLCTMSGNFGISYTAKNSIYVKTSDGRVYRFTRNSIESGKRMFHELISTDVTDIVEVSKRLHEDNLKRKEQFEQISDLVKRKRTLQRKEEILLQKVQLHRKLGECIIATRNAMSMEKGVKVHSLMKLWEDTIQGIEMNGAGGDGMDFYENIKELYEVARIMGCTINVEDHYGIKMENQPKNIQEGYVDLVREALCNAVRHGKANQLFIFLEKSDGRTKIRITNNGRCEQSEICEGGGLHNLRGLLQNKGMDLKISVQNKQVVLESMILNQL